MQQDALIDLEPIENDGIPYHEVRVKSEEALKALEKDLELNSSKSQMRSVFYLLMSKGYSWRQAAWVAWESLPPTVREPKTLKAFAIEKLGLMGPRVIYDWKKNYPQLMEAAAKIRMNQFLVARDEVIAAVIEVAKQPDYKSFNHQKMVLQETGDISSEQVHRHVFEIGEKELSEMSYEELLALDNELAIEASTQLMDEIDELYPSQDTVSGEFTEGEFSDAMEPEPNPDHSVNGLPLPCEGRGETNGSLVCGQPQGISEAAFRLSLHEEPVSDRANRSSDSDDDLAGSEEAGSSFDHWEIVEKDELMERVNEMLEDDGGLDE